MSTTVLIVEDEEVLREAYELMLQAAGYDTITAIHGQDALDKLKTITPDVMLLDVYMPVLSGCGVLAALNRDEHPMMKIIVCSNLSDMVMRQHLLDSGADVFALKSDLSPKELVQLVKDVTEPAL